MRLVTIGDSITRGTFTDIGESAPLSIAKPNYSERLGSLLKADVECRGINGVSMSATSGVNPEYAIANTARNIGNADVIIVAGGTNDYGTSVKLGEITDTTDLSFFGALEVTYRTIKKNNPTAAVFVVTPIPRGNEDEPNSVGHTLNDYRRAIERKAEEFGFFVVDGTKLAINPNLAEERKKYIPDGLHPNNLGHELYAQLLYEQITDNVKC